MLPGTPARTIKLTKRPVNESPITFVSFKPPISAIAIGMNVSKPVADASPIINIAYVISTKWSANVFITDLSWAVIF